MFNKVLLVLAMLAISSFGVKSQVKSRIGSSLCRAGENLEHSLCVEKQILYLVGSPITVKIYNKRISKKAIERTVVVVHNNEQKGLNAVKEVLTEKGFYGRLVEVVSNYQDGFDVRDAGNQKRYLYFGGGKFCVDPNRIYSVKGRINALTNSKCSGTPNDEKTSNDVKSFADNLIKIITLNNTHKFIIAVHNNTENGELSLNSWSAAGSEAKTALGIFLGNNHADSESSFDAETDNFVLVSNGYLAGQFLDNRVSAVALQEGINYLIQEKSRVDDGSMSLYFGATLFKKTGKPFSYVNIEAGGKDDADDDAKKWQKEMIKIALTKIKPY